MRPTIEDIILMDDFQEKCKVIKITLPIDLNKSKQLKKTQAKAKIDPVPLKLDESMKKDNQVVEEIQIQKNRSLKTSSTNSLSALRLRPLS